MRAFYLAYREIVQTASGESPSVAGPQKVQTVSGQLAGHDDVAVVANRLPLPWSQYVRLMAVRNPEARRFYETEALRGGWTIRQLDRQIGSQFYERTFASHLVMRGAAMKVVQELLGHATMEMTNRYSHLSPEVPRHAVKLLDGLDRVSELSGRQLGDKAHFST